MVLPLHYIEVEPIDVAGDALTARFVHEQMCDWSQQSLLLRNASKLIARQRVEENTTIKRKQQHLGGLFPVMIQHSNGSTSDVFLCEASTNPLESRKIPVKLRGYSVSRAATSACNDIVVHAATLVRILPGRDWKEQMMGTFAVHHPNSSPQIFLDDELQQPYGTFQVGTTRRTRSQSVRASLDATLRASSEHSSPLLVLQDESPTDIVQWVLQQDPNVRILSFGMMRAKYGAYADWGVACGIHEIAMEWAVRYIPGTILLLGMWDDPDERLQQYLESLCDSLQQSNTIPFPENPMYGSPDGGVRLSVRIKFIAVATPDTTKKKYRANVVRIPHTQSIETRLRGLQYAMAGATLDDDFDPTYLQRIATSIGWARGSIFGKIRDRVQLVQGVLSKTKFEAILSNFGSMPEPITMQQQAGGNDLAKQALQDAMNPEIELESLGLSAPTGILLYGPPGTGKTLLAKSLSRSMIVVHSTDVAQSTVGQGEKAVLGAFEAARKRSEPITVIFIDEFQALFTDRTAFAGSSRVTTTLFQCMDNLARWRRVDNSRRIIVLAATNTPWMIDEAFLRPGRFDRSIYVGLPSHEERKAILSLHLRNMKLEGDISVLSENLSGLTIGFSGADLAALCRGAVVQCLLEHGEKDAVKVGEHHFESVLKERIVAPSSDPTLVARIKDWQRRS